MQKFSVIVLLVLISFVFGFSLEKITRKSEVKTVHASLDMCSLIDVNHLAHIDCLKQFLMDGEKVADGIKDSIISKLRPMVPKYENSNDIELMSRGIFYKNLISSMVSLHIAWKPYRDSYCEVQSAHVTGNGYTDIYLECQIEESNKYIVLLRDIAKEQLK